MKKYKYTCIVCGAYSLLQYLLQTDDEEGNETFYFIDGDNINPDIYNNLPDSKYIIKLKSSKSTLWFRIKCLFKWRFIKCSELYAVDFLTYCPMLIANNNYILLEESPNIYTRKYKDENDYYNPDCLFYPKVLEKIPHKKGGMFDISSKKSLLWKVYAILSHGRTYRDIHGTNNQCINRFYTDKKEESSIFFENRKVTYLDYKRLWDSSSERKKQFILKVFGLNPELLYSLTNSKTVVYTNPLMEDCGLTEKEVEDIYSPFIKRYYADGIVIKPHPRERLFDYSKHFPMCMIFPKTVPSQLFDLFDIEFKTAITVFSSAILTLPSDTKIVWIGTNAHPSIYKRWGDIPCPEKFKNVERIN